MELILYHNPRCSKSRQALALLQERGVEPRIVRYLETPPTTEELGRILDRLGLAPRELMRTQEPPYRELGLDGPDLGREALIEAMVAHPILMERPIAVRGARAAVGRPPEKLLELL